MNSFFVKRFQNAASDLVFTLSLHAFEFFILTTFNPKWKTTLQTQMSAANEFHEQIKNKEKQWANMLLKLKS